MRKKKDKSSGGAPPPGAWLTTYGDMVTLLLCFFVVLFSMSSVDAQKFQQMLTGLQLSFGIITGGSTVYDGPGIKGATVLPEPGSTVIDMAQITELYNGIQSFLEQEGIEASVEAVLEERGVIIRFKDSVLFDTAKAEIRSDGAVLIDKIGSYLSKVPNHVRIEGHADNLPIKNSLYPSNWELSTARATSVIQYLLTKTSISPERLSAAGYGEYRPIAPNDTVENRARNRRVDLVLLRLDLNVLEPS